MRFRWLRALVVCAVILSAVWLNRYHGATENPTSGQQPVASPEVTPGLAESAAPIPPRAGPGAAGTGAEAPMIAGSSQTAAPPGAPGVTPLQAGRPEDGAVTPLAGATVAEAVRSAAQAYGAAFGGNPVGTNAEITRALNGNNPTHAMFLSGIPGQQINSKGELLDPWGTPYFFHQLSGSDMEVRSAGPDRKMWTSDDIVIK
jgi:hypothetical protein